MRKRKQYVELVWAGHRVAGRGSVLEGMEPTPSGRIRMKEGGAHLQQLDKMGRLIDHNGPIPEKRPDLGPCWIWTGPLNAAGYGPYRTVYETLTLGVSYLHRREHLHHMCQVKACVNPDHLEVISPSEHTRLHADLRRQEAARMVPPPSKLSGERCSATKPDGQPCKGWARTGGDLCTLHLLETDGNPYDTYESIPETGYVKVGRQIKPSRRHCSQITTRGKPCNGYAQGDTGLCRYHLDVLATT